MGDAPLPVGHLVVRAREEHAAVGARRLVRDRLLVELVGDTPELGGGEHVETALLPFGDHDTSRELVPKLGRQDQPTFFVEVRRWVPRNIAPHPSRQPTLH